MRALVPAPVPVAADDERAPTDRADREEKLVLTEYAGRHAVDREGAGPMPPAPPVGMRFGGDPPALVAEALAEGVVTDRAGMPVVRITAEESEPVIVHLDRINILVPGRQAGGTSTWR
jgi:hypothetical protein